MSETSHLEITGRHQHISTPITADAGTKPRPSLWHAFTVAPQIFVSQPLYDRSPSNQGTGWPQVSLPRFPSNWFTSLMISGRGFFSLSCQRERTLFLLSVKRIRSPTTSFFFITAVILLLLLLVLLLLLLLLLCPQKTDHQLFVLTSSDFNPFTKSFIAEKTVQFPIKPR